MNSTNSVQRDPNFSTRRDSDREREREREGWMGGQAGRHIWRRFSQLRQRVYIV